MTAISARACRSCGKQFVPRRKHGIFCSNKCSIIRTPAIYCFICPDGRRYISSRLNIHNRRKYEIGRNARINEALKRYHPKPRMFEIFETLPVTTDIKSIRAIELQYILCFETWDEKRGFNVNDPTDNTLLYNARRNKRPRSESQGAYDGSAFDSQ